MAVHVNTSASRREISQVIGRAIREGAGPGAIRSAYHRLSEPARELLAFSYLATTIQAHAQTRAHHHTTAATATTSNGHKDDA